MTKDEKERVKNDLTQIIPPGSKVSVELRHKSKDGETEHLAMSVAGATWEQRRDITDEASVVLGLKVQKDGGLRVKCVEDDTSDHLKRYDKGAYLIKNLSEKLYGSKNCLDGWESDEVRDYKSRASKKDLLDSLSTAWKPSDCKAEVSTTSQEQQRPEARRRLM